ncbi:helix-turn-helix domain-containing protein [Paenibacillus barcinonensis]|uniref:Helix-turn-helix domain-containing protein n=1 Tax=Paenibacillus barcinonensis TaxID=198119 RepID=A0ABX6QB20_PAEBA|nr:helix-turn-helix domain-containing protein [Paenibacillus barcinonensis]QKS59315.1 helix-turn-helix domain-containing protein [Paenibacillus barcinonensis]QKS59369.1 helix-turn-helix domain-containing protein [Paenibacillus barcinonensis]
MTIKDCMSHFKASRSTVMRRLSSGELKSFKFGGKRLIKREWVAQFEEMNREVGFDVSTR